MKLGLGQVGRWVKHRYRYKHSRCIGEMYVSRVYRAGHASGVTVQYGDNMRGGHKQNNVSRAYMSRAY